MSRTDDSGKIAMDPGTFGSDIGAKAYSQGSDIHLAPGQETLVAHELSHVIQQRSGSLDKGAPGTDPGNPKRID